MLKTEDEIIQKADKSKNDFGYVESILDREASTGQGAYSPDHIQKYFQDWPSFGALSFIVPVDRRSVLDQCYD